MKAVKPDYGLVDKVRQWHLSNNHTHREENSHDARGGQKSEHSREVATVSSSHNKNDRGTDARKRQF